MKVVIQVEDTLTDQSFQIEEDMDAEDYERIVNSGNDFFEEICKYLGERILISMGKA